jgi:ketosteroid isomerase-like protein
MTESAIRELCNRFFDAHENRRTDELLEDIYAPDAIIWTNVFNVERGPQEQVAGLAASLKRARRRTYDDRRISTFEGGFVIQYTLSGVHHTGHRGALSAAIVGLCRDGRITRIDEYMDTSKIPAWRGPGYHEDG